MNVMCSGSGGDSRVAFSENSSPVKEEGGDDVLTCCQECRLEYEKEASLVSIHQRSFLDREHLPSWLKPHADKVCLVLFFVIL